MVAAMFEGAADDKDVDPARNLPKQAAFCSIK
jgi:hypothetical protein